ncbi:MAG: hypothetical protein ABWZ25_14385 [Chitinophagaceae bacterium]
MKAKNILLALLVIIFLESCSRAITPFEAANNPRGKKCRAIR